MAIETDTSVHGLGGGGGRREGKTEELSCRGWGFVVSTRGGLGGGRGGVRGGGVQSCWRVQLEGMNRGDDILSLSLPLSLPLHHSPTPA